MHYGKSSVAGFQKFFASTYKDFMFILIIKLCVTYGERKNCKVSKHYDHVWPKNFLLIFMSLLTTPAVKNSHALAGIQSIFLRKNLWPNLKVFQYQIWGTVKRLEK